MPTAGLPPLLARGICMPLAQRPSLQSAGRSFRQVNVATTSGYALAMRESVQPTPLPCLQVCAKGKQRMRVGGNRNSQNMMPVSSFPGTLPRHCT